jgi:hypothetical protein
VTAPCSPSRLAAALLTAFVLAAAPAAASTVLLVRPANPGSVTTEALMRMHGELVSSGFDVSFATQVEGMDARATLDGLASSPGVDAVVAILGEGAPESIEVWVVDRSSGKSVIRRTPYQAGGDRDAEVLAIRAIELLRASLLEVDLAGSPRAVPAPAAAAVEVAREPGADSRWALEFGGDVITGFDGVGPALVPMLRFDGVVASWCLAQFVLAGLGTQARVGAAAGTAHVAQEFSLAGATFRWPGHKGVRPVVSLAGGVLHTTAEGQARWPYEEQTVSQWSFLADAGLGMHLAVNSRYELAVEAHIQLAQPYPVFQFVGVDVASFGHPTLLFSLALVAWL